MAGFNLAELFANVTVRGAAQFVATMNAMRNQAKAVDGAITGLASHATGIGARLAAGFGAYKAISLGINELSRAISNASQFEQFKTAIGAMVNSTTLAEEELSKLADIAEKTPLQLPQLVKGTQALLAYNFNLEEARKILVSVGDAAAASPGGMEFAMDRIIRALGQIKAKGRLAGQELLQLTEVGINGGEMVAAKMGISVPEALKKMEKGAISAEVAIAGIVEGIDKRFGGMMAKQARTLTGLFSTLQDSMDAVRRKVGEGLLPPIKEAVIDLTRLVDSFRDLESGEVEAYGGAWIQFAKDFGDELAKDLDLLGQMLDRLQDIVIDDGKSSGNDRMAEQFGKMAGRRAQKLTELESDLTKNEMPGERKRILERMIRVNKERKEFLRKEVEMTPDRPVDSKGRPMNSDPLDADKWRDMFHGRVSNERDLAEKASQIPIALIEAEIARLEQELAAVLPKANAKGMNLPRAATGFSWANLGFGASPAAENKSKEKDTGEIIGDGIAERLRGGFPLLAGMGGMLGAGNALLAGTGVLSGAFSGRSWFESFQAKEITRRMGAGDAARQSAVGSIASQLAAKELQMAKPQFMSSSDFYKSTQIGALSSQSPEELLKQAAKLHKREVELQGELNKMIRDKGLVWIGN